MFRKKRVPLAQALSSKDKAKKSAKKSKTSADPTPPKVTRRRSVTGTPSGAKKGKKLSRKASSSSNASTESPEALNDAPAEASTPRVIRGGSIKLKRPPKVPDESPTIAQRAKTLNEASRAESMESIKSYDSSTSSFGRSVSFDTEERMALDIAIGAQFVDVASEERNARDDKREKLLRDVENSQARLHDLNGKLQDLDAKLKESRRRNAALEHEVFVGKSQLQELEREATERKKSLAELRRRIDSAEKSLTERRRELKELDDRKKRAEKQLENARKGRESPETNKVLREASELEARLEKIENEITDVMTEIRQRAQATKKTLRSKVAQQQELEDRIEFLKGDLSMADDEEEQAAKSSKSDRLERFIEAAEQDMERLSGMLTETHTLIHDTKKALSQKIKQKGKGNENVVRKMRQQMTDLEELTGWIRDRFIEKTMGRSPNIEKTFHTLQFSTVNAIHRGVSGDVQEIKGESDIDAAIVDLSELEELSNLEETRELLVASSFASLAQSDNFAQLARGVQT